MDGLGVDAPERVRRPGGRSERVGRVTRAAALELAQGGTWPITVGDIAARARVSPVTIYRRWGSADGVLVDAVMSEVTETQPTRASGDVRADLLDWLRTAEAALRSRMGLALIRIAADSRIRGAEAAAPGGGSDSNAFLDKRLSKIVDILAADPALSGATVGLIFDRLIAPVVLRVLLPYEPSRSLEQLVDQLLDDIRTAAG